VDLGAVEMSAVRQARMRARQRKGVIVAPVEVPPRLVETLLELHWLRSEASENRREIGDAIARMLAEMVASMGRK
jgi:hypothetical protein